MDELVPRSSRCVAEKKLSRSFGRSVGRSVGQSVGRSSSTEVTPPPCDFSFGSLWITTHTHSTVAHADECCRENAGEGRILAGLGHASACLPHAKYGFRPTAFTKTERLRLTERERKHRTSVSDFVVRASVTCKRKQPQTRI